VGKPTNAAQKKSAGSVGKAPVGRSGSQRAPFPAAGGISVLYDDAVNSHLSRLSWGKLEDNPALNLQQLSVPVLCDFFEYISINVSTML